MTSPASVQATKQDTDPLPPTSDTTTAAVMRRTQRAVELHLAGLPYDAIAQTVGYTDRSAARKAVTRAIRESMAADVGEARDSAVARSDRMLRAWLPRALNGDRHAATVVLRWEEHRARLLGTYAPQRLEVTTEVEEQIRALAATLDALPDSDGVHTVTTLEDTA